MTTLAEETFLYEPYGKDYILQQHPSYDEKETEKNELWIVEDVENSVHSTSQENEVYACGCVTIWSRGTAHKNEKQLNKCLAVQTPVRQVLISNFQAEDSPSGSGDTSLCILEDNCLTICTSNGSVYANTLPFKVKKIWSSFNGLCIERQVSGMESLNAQKGSMPTVFTMTHPLDDMKPMVLQLGEDVKKCIFMTDAAQHIVYSRNEPPLVVTYDTTIGVHTIWRPRNTTEEDQPQPLNVSDALPEFSSVSFAQHILNDQSRLSLSPLNVKHYFSPLNVRHQPSPIRPIAYHSPFTSSLVNQSALGTSFSQSPALGMTYRTHSPRSDIAHESPRADTLPLCQTVLKRLSSPFLRRSVSESLLEDLTFEPLPPDVCLDFVWQEDVDNLRHGSKGIADRVFLTKDFLKNIYLCFLVKHLNRLRMLKTDSECSEFSFYEDLSVKEAASVNDLNVFIAISKENDVLIYSGSNIVSKLDIVSSVEKYCLSSSTKAAFKDIAKKMPSPVSGLTEQISTLSTSSEIYDSIFGGGCYISEIRNSTKQYVTLVLSNGKMLRTKVPGLVRNSFVQRCLEVVVKDLEETAAMKILNKVYLTLNSKQSHLISHGTEWNKLADCLLQLMGFPEFSRRLMQGVQSNSPSPPERKKPKKSESLSGSEEWEQLLESEESKSLQHFLQGFSNPRREVMKNNETQVSLTISSPLYESIVTIYINLSHFYEELKLDTENFICQQQLGGLLYFLSMCLGLHDIMANYENNAKEQYALPKQRYRICKDQLSYLMRKMDRSKMYILDSLLLQEMSTGHKMAKAFTNCEEQWEKTHAIFEVYAILEEFLDGAGNVDGSTHDRSVAIARRIVTCLLKAGFTRSSIGRLPFGIAVPIIEILHHLSFNEEIEINAKEADLLAREDIALLHAKSREIIPQPRDLQTNLSVHDGMNFNDEILKIVFSQDLRVEEVRRLLQSAVPVIINLVQKPEVSDYEFVREQEACLMVISKRTMALPVGRGMFSLGTAHPSMSETLSIPVLEMTGKVAQSNKTVSLAQMDLPGDLLHWPSFHNGVAAGLKVASGSSHVNSTWIVYNKLKYAELTEEHAGFLMALGLTGHLAVLPIHQLHDYLIKGHDLTSVALLLGMAATRELGSGTKKGYKQHSALSSSKQWLIEQPYARNRAGTDDDDYSANAIMFYYSSNVATELAYIKVASMDSVLYKLLSLHIESLLPPTALELGIPHSAHVAAIVAIGLLFSGSGESHLVRVLLNEINRPSGPEMENAVDRESHALAAGIALGMIMLGKGAEPPLYDIDIGYELYHYIVGRERRNTPNEMKEKYRAASHLVKEENMINTDVTAPSAIIALALMYLKTNNSNVADWLKPSDTFTLLETVKPDHLLLKVLARNLIMWDSIVPSRDWINTHLVEVFKRDDISQITGVEKLQDLSNDLDTETVGQCHSCIIAGCCMALGLKFAGSFNKDAFDTLLTCTKHFKKQLSSPLFEKTGHSVVEMCLVTCLLSLASVMAGSGNLEVLRIARQLHRRCTPDVTYGSHMAVHMAIGLLFLGGGRYTLTTNDRSVAVLLCSMYPKFPNTSRDNRYHLQALRHMYVLTCEPRLLVPRDIDTRSISYVPINVTLKSTPWHEECTLNLLAPCFVPELRFLKKISISGPRYWPLSVTFDDKDIKNDEFLRIISCFHVKKKAGYLPYGDDPKGNKNLMARTFSGQTNQIEVIKSFSADPLVIGFAEFLCKEVKETSEDTNNSECYSKILFDCVTKEKLEVLNIYLAIEQLIRRVQRNCASSADLGQVALLVKYYDNMHPRLRSLNLVGKPLLEEQFITGVRLRLRKTKQ